MSVLIIARENDEHAQAVEWAAHLLGKTCQLVIPDAGTNYRHSQIAIEDGNLHTRFCGNNDHTAYETVWFRRFRSPDLNHLHPDDIASTQQEIRLLHMGLLSNLNKNAKWINPLQASFHAENKIVQLIHAKKIGLKLPNTLVSCEPNAIRDFYFRNGKSVIVKPIQSVFWQATNRELHFYTSDLTDEDVDNEASLSLCPAIYQKKLDKSFEVRATFIGNKCFAGKIDTSFGGHSLTDARTAIFEHIHFPVTPVNLPPHILEQCQRFLASLNLTFGTFDFIVTQNDDYLFLECNQMGQFLWVENDCPEIPLLANFVEFLFDGACTGRYEKSIGFSDFLKSAQQPMSDMRVPVQED